MISLTKSGFLFHLGSLKMLGFLLLERFTQDIRVSSFHRSAQFVRNSLYHWLTLVHGFLLRLVHFCIVGYYSSMVRFSYMGFSTSNGSLSFQVLIVYAAHSCYTGFSLNRIHSTPLVFSFVLVHSSH